MAFDLTSITNLINSPPGQLVAGGVLAGAIWKFFEKVESSLIDNTKLKIALWLVGRKPLEPTVQPWPETFATVFDHVFTKRHFTLRCFFRSAIASGALFAIVVVLNFDRQGSNTFGYLQFPLIAAIGVITNVIPDFFSLLESRVILGIMTRTRSSFALAVLILIDLYITSAIASASCTLGFVLTAINFSHPERFQAPISVLVGFGWSLAKVWQGAFDIIRGGLTLSAFTQFVGSNAALKRIFAYPAYFTSIWLWLYAGSGFLLKFARRFDLGFGWFNRHFDIEHKPLSAIGFVAGCIVAVVYWAMVVVVRWVV